MQIGTRAVVLVDKIWPCLTIDDRTHSWVLASPCLDFGELKDTAVLVHPYTEELVGTMVVVEYIGTRPNSGTNRGTYGIWRIVS